MTLLSSLILSAVMFLSTPDALNQKEATETPCKENFYGYEIDIGEIAGTMVAEELNEYKTEFRDFINNAVEHNNQKYKTAYEHLTLSDIDFNDPNKISSYTFYKKYSPCEYNAKYDDVLSNVADTEYYNWYITKNNTVYSGFIYKNRYYCFEPEYKYGSEMRIGNYKITIDTIFDGTHFGGWLNRDPGYSSECIKQNIGRLLYENGEKNHKVKCIPVYFLVDFHPNCIIIFVDDTAKYISTLSINFRLLGKKTLKEDTPEHIRNLLESENKRLYFNADSETFEICEPHLVLKSLMPYNQIIYYMKLIDEWGVYLT
ncbi:MAG: hypothetical protein IJ446_11290 [Oscillospiraceae bacterium]|nr:hypothetical protein [Oscillospiraceae bacterium]